MLLTDVSDVKCFLCALFAIAEDASGLLAVHMGCALPDVCTYQMGNCKTCEALDYMDDYMSYMECMD